MPISVVQNKKGILSDKKMQWHACVMCVCVWYMASLISPQNKLYKPMQFKLIYQ